MNKFLFLLLALSLYSKDPCNNVDYNKNADAASLQNKIVFLISPPRSLSVGFLRMIEARGDFKIFHEPLVSVFDYIHYPELTKGWFREQAYQTLEQIKADIFKEAAHSNVFVKEMSFGSKEFIIDDLELMKRPNVFFVFLVRNPHHTVISFYKKSPEVFEGFKNVIGYEQAYELFEAVKAQGHNRPLILFSEELAEHPEATAQAFCKHVQIPFKESALSWENLGANFAASEWHENKIPQLVHHWHGDAIQSTKFEKLRAYALDDKGNPTFEEILNPEDRQKCKEAYEFNLPYYQKLQAALEWQ